MVTTILRIKEILRERARSRSAHYQDIKDGLFTPPVKIGQRAVGWPAVEVRAINAARIAGSSESEIKELVARLKNNRVAGWRG